MKTVPTLLFNTIILPIVRRNWTLSQCSVEACSFAVLGYEVLKILGKGSFGLVVKCYDHKTGQQIALKIVRNEKRFHRQAQEEIRILEHLRKQDRDNTFNVIHLFEWFQFRNHICITFELLSMNLYE